MVFSAISRHSGAKVEICKTSLKTGPRMGPKMGYRLKKTVVMVGMMGAGKTAIGTALAETLDVPFLDSDNEIVKAANMSIAEIFERFGEPFFRDKEQQVISRLLDGDHGVLSTGGGAYLAPDIREMIAARGVAVWLKADLDLLWARVKNKDTRPLLRTSNPKETLRNLIAAREPSYGEAELTVVSQPDYSIPDMTQRVIAVLKTRPDVLEVL
jgi:shikimate kinase